jgi:Zn-dependent protease
MINILSSDLLFFLIYITVLLIAITIHELSHGLMADYLGDPTPRIMKRLSINPLVHLDPLGLFLPILLILSGSPLIFGWGKPMPFDPFNLKNPRRDEALIALAGPMSNFILAIICSLLIKLFIFFNQEILINIGIFFFVPLLNLNLILGLFNLLPIYPLDGYKVITGILPENKALEWLELKKYGWIFLLMLIFPFGGQSVVGLILSPIFTFLQNLLLPSFGGIV